MSGPIFVALGAARWIHFASVMLLFGASLFPFYALRGEPISPLLARARSAVPFVAFIAFLSGVAWAAASLVNITGEAASLFDRDSLAAFFLDTGFGKVWLLRLLVLLAMLLVGFVARKHFGARNFATALVGLLSALLLVSQAWIGHPAATLGVERFIVIAGYALHVLGAAAWLGGLVPLWLLLRASGAAHTRASSIEFALRRFSGLGMLAIAMIVAGGLINAWARWSSLDALIASAWGRLVLAKLLGFAALIALAAVNRFFLMPRLDTNSSASTRLTHNVVAEQAGGLLILAAAAILGILPPPA